VAARLSERRLPSLTTLAASPPSPPGTFLESEMENMNLMAIIIWEVISAAAVALCFFGFVVLVVLQAAN
jgi:hypothetical protein